MAAEPATMSNSPLVPSPQAQTIAVWKQAKRYNIPCVVFVNKMDKPKAR